MTVLEYFLVMIPVTDPPPDHREKLTRRLIKEAQLQFGKETKVQWIQTNEVVVHPTHSIEQQEEQIMISMKLVWMTFLLSSAVIGLIGFALGRVLR